MAGTDTGFDAAEFREAIQFAMEMGMAPEEQDELVFRWLDQTTYAVADPSGKPYNWSADPTSETQIADLRVTCAFEFTPRASNGSDTTVAAIDESRLVITLLDEQYTELLEHGDDRKPDQVVVGGNTYELDFTAPPIGLFNVTVFQIFATALDES